MDMGDGSEAGSEHHVHFEERIEKDDQFKENQIELMFKNGLRKLDVHVGFLKIRHRYEIEFSVPKSYLPNSEDVTVKEVEPPNLNLRLLELRPAEKEAVLKIEFFAHKEKLLKEMLTLIAGDGKDDNLDIIFHARVLGKQKGTPLLRNGIKCIAIDPDPEESEASDWTGFS